MKREKRQKTFETLREKHPLFRFSDYSYETRGNKLRVQYRFEVPGLTGFAPTIELTSRFSDSFQKLEKKVLESFIFNIGMVELVSYWKATCSPVVKIDAGNLSQDQIAWWKKLYFNGLGEFFYLNGIDTQIEDFMNIRASGKAPEPLKINSDEDKILVPVGGGKDSVVTLEVLKKQEDVSVIPFCVNPRKAVIDTINRAGFSMNDAFVVERTLDKRLLDLNNEGYLNGHTPFSALLAFVSAFSAALSGIRYITLSNESSANESTVPGSNINHQYSKSFEFEEDFRDYLKRFITGDIEYFSFLRPLSELQIASLFARFTNHHFTFRSCNAGSKTGEWCGKCPKCLFTAAILSPFISYDKIIRIFHKDILNDNSLQPVMDELTGVAGVKPFECVGTVSEVNAALVKAFGRKKEKPALLKNLPLNTQPDAEFEKIMRKLDKNHHVPEKLFNRLKSFLDA